MLNTSQEQDRPDEYRPQRKSERQPLHRVVLQQFGAHENTPLLTRDLLIASNSGPNGPHRNATPTNSDSCSDDIFIRAPHTLTGIITNVWRCFALQSFHTSMITVLFNVLHIMLLLTFVLSPMLIRTVSFSARSMGKPLRVAQGLEEVERHTNLTASSYEAEARPTASIQNIWSLRDVEQLFITRDYTNWTRKSRRAIIAASLQDPPGRPYLTHYSTLKRGKTRRSVSLPQVLSTWVASPLYSSPVALILFYYLYCIGSLLLLFLRTGGRLTGHFALLRLVIVSAEGLWFVHRGVHSFVIYSWLFLLSYWQRFGFAGNMREDAGCIFAKQGTPYVSVPRGDVAEGEEQLRWFYRVKEKRGTNGRDALAEKRLDLSRYVYPAGPTLEWMSEGLTLAFGLLLVTCFVLDLYRVLLAFFGVEELGQTEGCGYCPLCGAAVEARRGRETTPGRLWRWVTGAATLFYCSAKHRLWDPLETGQLMTPSDYSRPGVHTVSQGHLYDMHHFYYNDDGSGEAREDSETVRCRCLADASCRMHYCPVMRLDEEGGVTDSTNMNSDSDGDADCETAASTPETPVEQLPVMEVDALREAEHQLRDACASHHTSHERQPIANASFLFLEDYGTLTGGGKPGPPNVFSDSHMVDEHDEFRPGDALPCFEQASWLRRITLSWLDTVVAVALLQPGLCSNDRYLPRLPSRFTSMDADYHLPWRLWVYRKLWYGSQCRHSDALIPDESARLENSWRCVDEGEYRTDAVDDETQSSDNQTAIVLERRNRPLTNAALQPRRPYRGRGRLLCMWLLSPLCNLLHWGFYRVYIKGSYLITRTRQYLVLELMRDRLEGSTTQEDVVDYQDSPIPADVAGDMMMCDEVSRYMPLHLRHQLVLKDVSLFALFLEHRCGFRFLVHAGPLLVFSQALLLAVVPLLARHVGIRAAFSNQEEVSAVNLIAGFRWGGVLVVTMVAHVLVEEMYRSVTAQCALEVATAIRRLVLEKTLALPLAQRTFSEKEILDLVTETTGHCREALMCLHLAWGYPLTIGFIIYLLSEVLGWAPALVVVVTLVLLLVSLRCLTSTAAFSTGAHLSASRRHLLQLLRTAVTQTSQIKAALHEYAFLQRIEAARRDHEVKEHLETFTVDLVETVVRRAGVPLVSVLALIVFYLRGGIMEATTLIPAFALFMCLHRSTSDMPLLFRAIEAGYLSMKCLECYLRQPPDDFTGTWADVTLFRKSEEHDGEVCVLNRQLAGEETCKPLRAAVFCCSSSFTWQHSLTHELPRATLSNVRMSIQPGELVVVQGPEGAGKSTLLLAILGETNRCARNVSMMGSECLVRSESASYVSLASSTKLEEFLLPDTTAWSAPLHTVQDGVQGSDPSTTGTVHNTDCPLLQPAEEDGGFVVFGRAVYCSSAPWLRHATVCANITGCTELSSASRKRWYSKVLQACALDADLKELPKGDDTVIEASGWPLTTSAQVRVALARAVFSQADIYLLDDLFLTLSAEVRTHICKEVFHTLLRRKTVIVATNICQKELRPHRIFTVMPSSEGSGSQVIDDTALCTRACPLSAKPTLHPLYAAEWENRKSQSYTSKEDPSHPDAIVFGAARSLLTPSPSVVNEVPLSLNSGRQVSGGWGTGISYESFLEVLGWVDPGSRWRCFCLTGLQFVLLLSLLVCTGTWLTITPPAWEWDFALVSAVLGVSFLVVSLMRHHYCIARVRSALSHVYQHALVHVLKASVSQLNLYSASYMIEALRFDAIHDGVAANIAVVLGCITELMAVVLVAAILSPWLFLSVILVGSLACRTLARYFAVAYQTQRLEVRLLCRVAASLREAWRGVATIRSLGLQDRVRGEYNYSLDSVNTATMLSLMLERWVAVRVRATCILLAGVVALHSVVLVGGRLSPGMTGVALLMFWWASFTFTQLIDAASALQGQWRSVQQLLELHRLPQEPLQLVSNTMQRGCDTLNVSYNPGGRPALELLNVSSYYSPSLTAALRHFTLAINLGERVGIVGRSGNGKSAVFSTLLRLICNKLVGRHHYSGYANGQLGVIRIQGRDAAQVPYPVLREAFVSVPQEPLLLGETWRDNLSCLWGAPSVSDSAMLVALQAVGLYDVMRTCGGLDSRVVESSGRDLPAERRQLLRLAMAIVRQPPFLLLEELPCVSEEVVRIIHRVLAEFLGQTTVLIIAHRMATVRMLCSRVVVMHRGSVASDVRLSQVPPVEVESMWRSLAAHVI